MWKTYLGGVHFSSSTKYIKLKTLPIANEVRAHLASTHQFLGSVADKEILQEPAPSPCHDSSAVQSAIPSKCIGGEPAPRFEKWQTNKQTNKQGLQNRFDSKTMVATSSAYKGSLSRLMVFSLRIWHPRSKVSELIPADSSHFFKYCCSMLQLSNAIKKQIQKSIKKSCTGNCGAITRNYPAIFAGSFIYSNRFWWKLWFCGVLSPKPSI